MSDDLQVRIASMQDEDGIMQLTNMIHEEIGLYHYDADKVRQIVRNALEKKLAMIGVVGPHDDIRASLYLNIEPVWYSQDWHVCELWNFVHPDHRRHDYGSRLIKWAKSIADQMDMNLFIGILNNVRTEAKSRMYERLMPKAGTFFLYRPPQRMDG